MHRRLTGLTVVAIVAGVALVGTLAEGGTVQPHPWELRGDPAPSDTTLPLAVLGGGCGADTEQVARVEIEETPEQVTIATYIRKDRWHNGPCTASGTAHPVTAHLNRPLGSRELVDAACTDRRTHQHCDPDEQ